MNLCRVFRKQFLLIGYLSLPTVNARGLRMAVDARIKNQMQKVVLKLGAVTSYRSKTHNPVFDSEARCLNVQNDNFLLGRALDFQTILQFKNSSK